MKDKDQAQQDRMQARHIERRAYSVQDVADMLGVSKDIVYRLVNDDELPHKRLGGRIIVPAPMFEIWLKQKVNAEGELES